MYRVRSNKKLEDLGEIVWFGNIVVISDLDKIRWKVGYGWSKIEW